MEKKTIGTFIAALRKANGMTQQDLADRLGVSNKAVSRWERDENAPDLSLIPAIAEIFGVTCDELLKGERIFSDAEEPTKPEPKVDKQLKALVNRSISSFKTMIYIAIALSIIGLVFLFGTTKILMIVKDFNKYSYPSDRKFVNAGLTVTALFEVVALMLTFIATSRMIDTRRNNQLFEISDQQICDHYNNTLFRYSYGAFWVIYAVMLISNWFRLLWKDLWDYPYYLLYLGTLALLLLPASFPRKFYRGWIMGKPYRPHAWKIMNILQLLFLVISAVFFYESSLEKLYENLEKFHQLRVLGWLFLSCVILLFIPFLLAVKKEKQSLVLCGIRNICLIASVICFHRSQYIKLYTSPFDGSIVPNQECSIFMRWLAIGSVIVIFVVYYLFKFRLAKKSMKNTPD